MNNKQNGVSRLLRLVWKEYKIEMLVVILAIIGSALASVKRDSRGIRNERNT